MSCARAEAENHQSKTTKPGQDTTNGTTNDTPNVGPQESMNCSQENPDIEKAMCLDITQTKHFTNDEKMAENRNQSTSGIRAISNMTTLMIAEAATW